LVADDAESLTTTTPTTPTTTKITIVCPHFNHPGSSV
jgi:hypothetical protein